MEDNFYETYKTEACYAQPEIFIHYRLLISQIKHLKYGLNQILNSIMHHLCIVESTKTYNTMNIINFIDSCNQMELYYEKLKLFNTKLKELQEKEKEISHEIKNKYKNLQDS